MATARILFTVNCSALHSMIQVQQPALSFSFRARRAADPDRSWVALGTFSRTQKPGHAHRQALGVLIKKMPVPRFQLYFFSPKPRFYFCELLWFWKWRRFLNFYPMKTISSRKSEVKSQVGHRTVRFGMSPSRRVQRAIATYVLEWPIPKSNFEPKIPYLGLRPATEDTTEL